MSTIQRLETSHPRMSQIFLHNNIIFLSGQVDESASSTAALQTKAILTEISIVSLALSPGVIKVNYLEWRYGWPIWNGILDRYESSLDGMGGWREYKPVRACVEAKLAAEKYLVEIQVEAVVM